MSEAPRIVPLLHRTARTVLLGALLAVALAVLLASSRRERPPAWKPAVRLTHELSSAVELPSAPPVRRLLALEGPLLGSAFAGVPFRAEVGRPFIVRVRLAGRDDPRQPIQLRGLRPEEALRFGDRQRAIQGTPPGALLGALVRSAPAPSGRLVAQRFDRLRPGQSAALIVFPDPGAVEDVEVIEAETPPPTATSHPSLRPLVRQLPRPSPTGVSWRECLVAPGGGRYGFEVVLPPDGELRLATSLEPGERAAATRFVARLDGQVLLDEVVADVREWHEHRIALPGPPGKRARLQLETTAAAGEPARGVWANPRIVQKLDKPSILLVTLDAVRPDHLSAYGYRRDTSPALERVAAEGVKFLRATAQGGSTWQSISSLFSGLQPARSGVRSQGERLPTDLRLMSELLADAGYDTIAGSDLAAFSPVLLGRFDDADTLVEASQLSSGVEAQAPAIARRLAERPTFAWIHLENAHYPLHPSQPLRYDATYDGRFKTEYSLDDHQATQLASALGERELAHVAALYDSAVRDADDLVRKILSALDAAHAVEKTILIIAADHGEMVAEHGFTLDHGAPWDSVLHVPLFLAWPGHIGGGRTVEQRVQLVDVLPTALALAGVRAPARLDGRDLSSLLNGGALAEVPAYAEVARKIHVQYRGDEKLIVSPPGARDRIGGVEFAVPQRALFDVSKDPGELDDLAARDPRRAQEAMDAFLPELRRQRESAQESGEAPALGQAALEALQQAGYLAAAPRGHR